MKEKTLEQYRKEIRASIARDSKVGLWFAFWQHLEYISDY